MNVDETMLDVYIYENQQLLDSLEDILLNGEKQSSLSADQIDEVFRVMHTIKGSSAMMNFDTLATLTHAIEDLFALIREKGAPESDWSNIFDLVLGATSFVGQELAKLSQRQNPDGNAGELIDRIHGYITILTNHLNGVAAAEPAPAAAPAQPAEAAPAAPAAPAAAPVDDEAHVSSALPIYKAKLTFDADAKMEHIRALGVVTNFAKVCTQVASIPEDLTVDSNAAEISKNGLIVFAQTGENPDVLRQILAETMFVSNYSLISMDADDDELPFGMRAVHEAAHDDAPKAAAPAVGATAAVVKAVTAAKPAAAATEIVAKQNFISVNVNKLDSLLDIVGEIVTAESMVINNPDLDGLKLENFSTASSQLKSLVSDLQDIVMSIRMLPVSTVFQKMKRLVRDMAKKCEKDVNLVLIGEETEVDKNVIDYLSDPLMHIIRNAVDHGIETPEARSKKGKPTTGTITLEAKTTGNDVVVTITDDGKGLDKSAIIRKAIEKGIVNKPENEITEKEAFSFIFLPGFSTKEVATEFSGRGVGMDVARKNITKLGGNITVDSTPNQGTVYTIRIPLTLTIVDGMRILIGNVSFIIPTLSIKETFKPEPGAVFTDSNGHEMIILRENCYSVIRLNKFFGIAGGCEEISDGMLMLIDSENSSFCILIDQLVGEHQVVVKSLPHFLSRCTTKLDGISGCTILGDGTINLIMDVNSLMKS